MKSGRRQKNKVAIVTSGLPKNFYASAFCRRIQLQPVTREEALSAHSLQIEPLQNLRKDVKGTIEG